MQYYIVVSNLIIISKLTLQVNITTTSMSTVKSSEQHPSIIFDKLSQNKPKSTGALPHSHVLPMLGNHSLKNIPETRPQTHYTPAPVYTPMPHSYTNISQASPVYYPADYNYQYMPVNYQPPNIPYFSYQPSYPLVPAYSNPYISYPYITYQPYQYMPTTDQMYSHIVGQKQPRPSQRRITYCPYQRPYIDYEQHVVIIPVEKSRTRYIQKVYQTEYIPQAYHQVVLQSMPVQKQMKKIEYVPVQRKIIHFPKDERLYIIADQNGRSLKKQTDILTPQNTADTLSVNNLTTIKKEGEKQSDNQIGTMNVDSFRQSPVKQIYSPNYHQQ